MSELTCAYLLTEPQAEEQRLRYEACVAQMLQELDRLYGAAKREAGL